VARYAKPIIGKVFLWRSTTSSALTGRRLCGSYTSNNAVIVVLF